MVMIFIFITILSLILIVIIVIVTLFFQTKRFLHYYNNSNQQFRIINQFQSMNKESRRENYQQKRNNNQKYKLKKQIQSQADRAVIQSIQKFSTQQLLKFLQQKYEDYEQGNQKLLCKLNNQIGKRLMRIPQEINFKQFTKMKNILHAQNNKISDQEIKFIFEKKYLPKNLLKVYAISQYLTTEIIVMKFIFNKDLHNSYIKKVCIQNIPQYLYHFPLHKRMRKQGIDMIEGLLKYSKSLDVYEKV